MQKVDPIVKQIGHLIDARFQTFEININAKIKESADGVTKNLKAEIKASEERVTKRVGKVEDKVGGIEERLGSVEGKLESVEKRLARVDDKLDSNISNHEQRIKKLERLAAISA